MNGGDEVNALVLDIGSYTVKAGYAGDDTPKTFFPSCVGLLSDSITAPHENGDVKMEDATAPADKSQHKRLVGNNAVDLARDAMEVLPIMRGGQYDDWDNVDSVFHHIFRDRLNANAAEHPILMAEPSFQPDQSREKLVELLFEQHGPPAVFLGKNAMLSSFAVGRQTSLIVDSGHDATVGEPCSTLFRPCKYIQPFQINSFSMSSFSRWICAFSWLASFVVTEQAITARETPQALPKAALDRTKT